ncbi:MAG TPA: SAM-dependent methyltransferase [Streptosporangiaceae bacterium]|jgi:O-methyltransferase involved in polyketide biosynthesis
MADVDTTKPNIARIYDYWLGGKDNFKADRVAAEAVRQQQPLITELVLENRQFLTRAVNFVAAQGVRQFVDVGSGLPTSPIRAEDTPPLWLSTHEAARAAQPGALVAYVDYDPVAVVHSQALLAHGSDQVVAVQADLRDPAGVLGNQDILQAGFDPESPVCVILGCVLHFLQYPEAREVAAGYIESMAPGSYAVVTVGRGDGDVGQKFENTYNAQNGVGQVYNFTREQVADLFAGLELEPPGIVPAPDWRPEGIRPASPKRGAMILAGVGRRL